MSSVIVLNADYSFLNTVSWKTAVKLVVKGKAEVIKGGEKLITNFEKTIEIAIPKVIKLIKFVRMMFKKKVPLTKRNIFIRDAHTCVFCGERLKKATIDHLVPKSRGGGTSWENCVTACLECNMKKGNKTPNEAKMFLKEKPVRPTVGEFLQCKAKDIGLEEIITEIMDQYK